MIVTVFLFVTICLTAFPANASAGFDWTDWEVSENHDDPIYSFIGYTAPFQDATLDEIIHSVANVLAEYIQASDSPDNCQHRKVIFSYSSDEAFNSAMQDEGTNTIIGTNNHRFSDTIALINNRIFNLSGSNSALLSISPFRMPNEPYVDISVNTRSGDEVKRKLMEIANAAKAYSSTDRGRLEYINRYLIDNVRYGSGGLDTGWGQTTYEAIMLGRAVCGGFTSAVQDLCFLLGIPSIALRGNNHVWNYVYVDGQWRMLDVTWNASFGTETRYFLVESISGDTHNITRHDDSVRIEIAKGFALRLHKKVVQVVVDGRPIVFDVQPRIVNNRTMVPMRGIFEALGAELRWDGETQTVYANVNDRQIVLTIGDTSPTVNGVAVPIDQSAFIKNGRTIIPLRFVAEASGATVNWDGALLFIEKNISKNDK